MIGGNDIQELKFYQHSDSRTLLDYLSIICRPHIEYASPVSYYHKTEIEATGSIQKFALKMCLKSWSSNYEQLLLEARLPSLKARSALSLSHLYIQDYQLTSSYIIQIHQ